MLMLLLYIIIITYSNEAMKVFSLNCKVTLIESILMSYEYIEVFMKYVERCNYDV
jgi:hypothetical protein